MVKSVIIVAGGKGVRMGGDIPKQFLLLGGSPLLMHTINRFSDAGFDNIVLVLPSPELQKYWKELCDHYSYGVEHIVAEGGETRFHSVQNGLQFVDESGYIAVHDGVRPFVSYDTIERVVDEVLKSDAVIPVVEMIESLREISNEESRSCDRTSFCIVQTPQIFKGEVLKKAYQQTFRSTFTDDATVVEAAGYEITLVKGNMENIKITTPFDFVVAEALLKEKLF
ncbi:2-C-methyl-D-erythritol 4-phosphate cytidylyltransferase [Marinilabiliaceae bacterium ANBcel2]|nr:2-C-methyl-D-erythritol 4-phosphate cytidylyltransferase [Marinilabiliaceae bacterium ANBcel2]